MSTIQDLVAAMRDLLEPDPEVNRDLAGEEPLKWDEDTLYVFPFRNVTTPIETGPTVRQDFGLVAVWVARGGEEARQKRSVEVSAALDVKRGAYMEAVRTNQVTAVWDHIQAAERARPPRTLQARAVAIEVTGYRIVG